MHQDYDFFDNPDFFIPILPFQGEPNPDWFYVGDKVEVVSDPYEGMINTPIGLQGIVQTEGDKIIGIRFNNGVYPRCWLVDDANGTRTIVKVSDPQPMPVPGQGDGDDDGSDDGDNDPELDDLMDAVGNSLCGNSRYAKRPDNVHEYIFDSVKGMIDNINEKHFIAHKRDADWVGERFRCMKDAEEKYTKFWKEGNELLDDCIRRLDSHEFPELRDHKRRTRFNEDDGDEVEYDRLLSGEQFWRECRRDDIVGPTDVTVVIDMTTPGHVDSKDVMWRGAAALALTNLLEDKGYTVELWAVDGSPGMFLATNLKRAGEAMDKSSLVNAISSWFHRSLTHAFLHTIEAENIPGVRPMGVRSPSEADLDSIAKNARRIYISRIFSMDGAIDLVKDELDRIIAREPSM